MSSQNPREPTDPESWKRQAWRSPRTKIVGASSAGHERDLHGQSIAKIRPGRPWSIETGSQPVSIDPPIKAVSLWYFVLSLSISISLSLSSKITRKSKRFFPRAISIHATKGQIASNVTELRVWISGSRKYYYRTAIDDFINHYQNILRINH